MKKRLLTCLIASAICLVACEEPNQSSSPVLTNQLKSIEILKDSITIEELEVIVEDTFTLNYSTNNDSTIAITWESSNPDVLTVDANGNVTVKGKGSAIITATATDYPYIQDSIFVNATNKLGQTGVGSGLSADDPIFLGNEGEDEPIEVYFNEMQQIYGDSIFIKKGNVEVLIDAGYEYDGKYVEKLVTEKVADGRLDALMLSHSDGDHINGLVNALVNVENISLMVDYGGVGTGNTLTTRKKYKELGMSYYSAYDSIHELNGAAKRYYLTSEFYFDVLNTGNYILNTDSTAGNGKSLVVLFTYKDFTFFTGGDLTSSSEEDLLKLEDLPEVTLFKAHHHGSHGSNSQELLDTLNPKAIAISAAKAGSYGVEPSAPNPNNTTNLNGTSGHPAANAIERFYKAPNISKNLNVYWNAVNGTMKFTSYGEDDFTFEGSTPKKGYYDLTLTGGLPVWDETIKDFKNKVTGEENFKLHESKVFVFRDYIKYLPEWAQKEYFPDYNQTTTE